MIIKDFNHCWAKLTGSWRSYVRTKGTMVISAPDGRVVIQREQPAPEPSGLVRSRPLGSEPGVLQLSQPVATASPPAPAGPRARGVAYGAHVQARLLTNLETETQKLLQIILIGQPELRTLLAQPELAGSFDIRSIPTLMILRDKVLLFSQAGALPEAALEDLIKQVRALDMDKVRAEIAEQEKQGTTGTA